MTERSISPFESRALEYIRAQIPSLETDLVATRDFALEINRDQSLGLDEEQIVLACLCHDLARLHPPDEIAGELESRGIDLESCNFTHPILAHGFLSAELAREEIGIEDEVVLDAIRWHATGRAGMSLLDKLIYVADKIEETREFEGVDELRKFARQDLESAFPRVITWIIKYVVDELRPLDYNSVAAYNSALRDMSADPGRE